MRLIRYKIRKDNKLLLAELAREHKLEGSLVADLYALLRRKGAGYPSDKRIKSMAKKAAAKSNGEMSENTASILIRKRAQQLKSMTDTGFFKSLVNRADSIEALRIFVISFQKLNRKIRQAQCITCNLMKKCQFGQQYKDVVKDVGKVLDPDYAKKVHEDCPSLPDIDATNQMAAAAEAFKQMLQQNPQNAMMQNKGNGMTQNAGDATEEVEAATKAEAEADKQEEADVDEELEEVSSDEQDDPPMMYAETFGDSEQTHMGHKYTGTHAGNNFVVFQKMIDALTAQHLTLFDLGKKFSLALSAQKKGKFKPAPQIDKSATTRQIESISDLTKLQSAQHGLPDEVFDKKLQKKELLKQQPLQKQDKKQLLYLLIDNSGSMSGWLRGGAASPNRIVTRGALASTLCLSIIQRVEEDGGIVFLRFFSDTTSRLIEARTKEEFERLKYLVAESSFNGGGTNLMYSLGVVVTDIAAAKDEIAGSEILMVTDCEDHFDLPKVQKTIQGREFNVLDVSGGTFQPTGVSGLLKQCATKYYKADEAGVNVQDIVKLV